MCIRDRRDPLDLGPVPANTYDERTLWWRHERLHRLVMRNPQALLARYGTERDAAEADWCDSPPEPPVAFAAADDLEASWLDRVTEAVASGAAPESRPARVARMWRRWDRAAGMPGATGLRR